MIINDVIWSFLHHLVNALTDNYRINIVDGVSFVSFVVFVLSFIAITRTRFWAFIMRMILDSLMDWVKIFEIFYMYEIVWQMMCPFKLRMLNLNLLILKGLLLFKSFNKVFCYDSWRSSHLGSVIHFAFIIMLGLQFDIMVLLI